jgi:DNA-binding transcriptional regulator YiaG
MKEDKDNFSSSVVCPNCELPTINTAFQTERFPYGEGPDAVELSAVVPVKTCTSCGFKYSDDSAEHLYHEAICRHLGVMCPDDVVALREGYGLTRPEFAKITRLGVATLARWERGELIQNAAYDQFLYLLRYPENIDRLRRRKIQTAEPPSVIRPQLRMLQPTTVEIESAAAFELCPTGT